MKLLFWRRPRVAVVELYGMLSRRGPLSLEAATPALERAFRATPRGGGLILHIDSPGGSPVQSDLISALIRRLAEERAVRVHAVVQEVGASGGYWLACAADEILANPMSIVGSIGVIGGGFGFSDLLHRIGVRRRLYTAGENKGRLDPFVPERPQDIAFVQKLMDDIHARFKDWVRTRRGDRLKVPESEIFDGSYMLGERAQTAGLIDGFGDVAQLVRRIGGPKATARVFRPKPKRGLLGRLPRLAIRYAADELLDIAEEASARLFLR